MEAAETWSVVTPIPGVKAEPAISGADRTRIASLHDDRIPILLGAFLIWVKDGRAQLPANFKTGRLEFAK
jgi:hypothetical protein